MITVTGSIQIDERDIQFEFIRASGPGGQNVNKVATSVQLRYDVMNSSSLEPEVKQRLFILAKNRITGNGILIIEAQTLSNPGAKPVGCDQSIYYTHPKGIRKTKTTDKDKTVNHIKGSQNGREETQGRDQKNQAVDPR